MKERNTGIDLLRLLAMGMIVTLHVLGQGGALGATGGKPLHYHGAWLWETASYCGVNCFALISGYVGLGRDRKLSRALLLWCQVFFWTAVPTALFALFAGGVTGEQWRRALLPVTFSHYWYVTAYFGLLILQPLLNAAAEHASVRARNGFFLGVFLLMSLLPVITGERPYGLGGGYSLIWLVLLYLGGAFMKRDRLAEKLPGWAWLVIYAVCVLTAWGLKVCGLPGLIGYTTPAILGAGWALTAWAGRLRIGPRAAKVITFFAPCALGVYLIHVSEQIWTRWVKGLTAGLTNLPFALFMIAVPLAAAAGLALLLLLDKGREKLFRAAGLPALCEKLAGRIRGLFARIGL